MCLQWLAVSEYIASFRNMIVLATFACITTWILYTALRSLSSACFHAAEAKRLGCQPAQAKKAKGIPFGIQFLRKTLQAGRRHTYLDSITKLMNRKMLNTLEFYTLGSKNIVTWDPENIRAILQTQFQQFGLGRRKQTFHLALGHGIFTSDGLEWYVIMSRDLVNEVDWYRKETFERDATSTIQKGTTF